MSQLRIGKRRRGQTVSCRSGCNSIYPFIFITRRDTAVPLSGRRSKHYLVDELAVLKRLGQADARVCDFLCVNFWDQTLAQVNYSSFVKHPLLDPLDYFPDMGTFPPCPRLFNPPSTSQTANGTCLAEATPPPVVSISNSTFGSNPCNSTFTPPFQFPQPYHRRPCRRECNFAIRCSPLTPHCYP